jgi:hypothetical protein
MSASLAAAKKRRANIQEPTRVMPNGNMPPQTNAPISTGLTLPQVIQIVDNRLIVLEKFMNETKNGSVAVPQQMTSDIDSDPTTPVDITDVIEEFDSRYKMLAEEITNLKNIVLSLQSYTMEVNKTLLEERVRIFSDLDKPPTPINISSEE